MTPTDFCTLLTAQPGVSAAVGDRVYPVLIPPEVWDSATRKPCFVYRTSGVGRSATTCGTIRLQADSVEVDCYARTFDDAYALARLAAQIVDFKGTVGNTSVDTVRLDSEIDLFDLEPGLYRRSLTFTVWNRSV